MRRRVIRLGAQRAVVKRARLCDLTLFGQNICEIDKARGVFRMMHDRLAVGGQRSGPIAHRECEAGKIGERAEMRRLLMQERKISLLGFVIAAQQGEQSRALEHQIGARSRGCEFGVDFGERGFIRAAFVRITGGAGHAGGL